jgi:hypothetical protein
MSEGNADEGFGGVVAQFVVFADVALRSRVDGPVYAMSLVTRSQTPHQRHALATGRPGPPTSRRNAIGS